MMTYLCKKLVCVGLVALIVTGCASSPPKPPEPKGDVTRVNPVKITIEDLKNY